MLEKTEGGRMRYVVALANINGNFPALARPWARLKNLKKKDTALKNTIFSAIS